MLNPILLAAICAVVSFFIGAIPFGLILGQIFGRIFDRNFHFSLEFVRRPAAAQTRRPAHRRFTR